MNQSEGTSPALDIVVIGVCLFLFTSLSAGNSNGSDNLAADRDLVTVELNHPDQTMTPIDDGKMLIL